jgi:8-oxo-dGTP pyrophosphatase MutT (NUDIX family)
MRDQLLAHNPQDDVEAAHLRETLHLLDSGADCYVRTHFNPGHITGSALLLSADNARILMNHHKILNKWLSFGGHADGDRDIQAVAEREVCEESGIKNIELIQDCILDVDVHGIPENPLKNEPAHKHFDIRYAFRVRTSADEEFKISHESLNLQWCGFEEALGLVANDESMQRLIRKVAARG